MWILGTGKNEKLYYQKNKMYIIHNIIMVIIELKYWCKETDNDPGKGRGRDKNECLI